jgi:hypothetical protein
MSEHKWQPAITKIPKEHLNETPDGYVMEAVGIKVRVREATPSPMMIREYRAVGCDSKRFFHVKHEDIFPVLHRTGIGWMCEHEILTD